MIQFETKNAGLVKIFTDNIEDSALAQIKNIAESPYCEKNIHIMPDVHAGKGITIGFSGLLYEYVNPEHIGCDIGCNITADFLDKPIPKELYPTVENEIKKSIPMGFNINDTPLISMTEIILRFNMTLKYAYILTGGRTNNIQFESENDLRKWLKRLGMDENVFLNSIGTVGGGNHFIEYDEGNGNYCFTVHCGSRNLGIKVFNYWNKIANNKIPNKNTIRDITIDVKNNYTGDKRYIKDAIDKAINEYKDSMHTGWLSGDNMNGYLTDMVICQEYAKINHLYIHRKLREIYENLVGGNSYYYLSTMHNYIDFDCNIPVVRKGAVRANSGEMFILPFNMRDGIAICTGNGNVDWNCTSPHGAGRKMSRNMAKNSLSVEKFQNQMKESGVYTTTADKTTIDEAPDAYKDMYEIIKLISPTCKIEYFMKPKINLKAAE